jgi:bifunctional non-homologous end joining protein LigD
MAELGRYRSKRDFSRTREPSGRKSRRRGAGGEFVVQKHAASRLHYDLRLELDGVFLSWAVPKGFDIERGERRLAVHVEDHPLEYGEFEGTIPAGEYGAGTVMLWDRGRWRPAGDANDGGYGEGKLDFVLEGERLHGHWTLVRTRMGREKEDNWLLIRRSNGADQPAKALRGTDRDRSVASGRTMEAIADPAAASKPAARAGKRKPGAAKLAAAGPAPEGARREKLPASPKPCLATRVDDAPEGEDWLHEIKLDGYRLFARLAEGKVKLFSRNGKDWTRRFAELVDALKQVPVRQALIDGELVALRRDGVSSFGDLQEALTEGRTSILVFQAFDLLYLDGMSLARVPLEQRKHLLRERLDPLDGSVVRYLPHIDGAGPEILREACELGLEGIISKRRSAGYTAGRGRSWLKIKCGRQDEFVVGGYTDPKGSRGDLGALLLGAFDAQGELRYVGRVGSGFGAQQRRELRMRLDALARKTSPFAAPVPGPGVRHWVRPELVADIAFTERTRDGRLRHPVFRGLREDKSAAEIKLDTDQAQADVATPGRRAASARTAVAATHGRTRAKQAAVRIAGVPLTNPDRVVFPDQGLTKRALAEFYEQIEGWILPNLVQRPLAVVRCPSGRGGSCFYQKHPSDGYPEVVRNIQISGKRGVDTGLYIDSLGGLVGLVQMGVLELHAWGCRIDDIEKPDLMVFDLDPDESLGWAEVIAAATSLAARLEHLGLPVFTRLTGGKGVHLVIPIRRGPGWDELKAFTRAVAEAHARDAPGKFTVTVSKARRKGRIFIDYLRNGRGATAIASYSTRARPGAPVATPIRLDELGRAGGGDKYTVANLRRRLQALSADPWEDFERARVKLTAAMKKAVGMTP